NATGHRVEGSVPHDIHWLGHGTHTSGTVSGGDASGQYIGVAPNVSLIHALAAGNGDYRDYGQTIASIQWAVKENAEVISMSLGWDCDAYINDFLDPVLNAQSAGAVVVVSAGNSNEGCHHTPGNIYDALTIGASNSNKSIATFSSGDVVNASGFNDTPSDWPSEYVIPDVSAPGVNVRSSSKFGNPEYRYIELSGTSMAAPHVSGAAALMESATQENLSPQEIKSALIETAWKPADCTPNCTP
ncbi:MAG: S8 family serine peptidase, partial [Halobacteria archaeon]|nr:S8 family serine peptidase [Halobacteria archaeon]